MITCAHVVTQADGSAAGSISVTYGADRDDNVELVEVTDRLYPDLALLKVKWVDHPCVWLDGEANPLDDLYGFGFPWDEKLIRDEPIGLKVDGYALWSVKERPGSFPVLKLRDDQIRPGMSGSPLQNERTIAVCAILKRTLGEHASLGGYGISATEVLNRFPLVEDAQREIRVRKPLRRSNIVVATDPVFMEMGQVYGMSEDSVRTAFWGNEPDETETAQAIYSSPWKWMGAIEAAARRNPEVADDLRELQNTVHVWTKDWHGMTSWARGIRSARLTGNITLRNEGSHAHAVTVKLLSTRITDPQLAEQLNADIPPEVQWLPGGLEILATAGPADTEEALKFILRPGEPHEFKVSADLQVSAPEDKFPPKGRWPLFHDNDYLAPHLNAELAYLKGSLALRKYLLAGQAELTLGLSIDSNPVTRSIRARIVLPEKRGPDGQLLDNCVGFQGFGDFLIRWLAVRRGGVAQWLKEQAPPAEPSP
jgi:hypothetical protein